MLYAAAMLPENVRAFGLAPLTNSFQATERGEESLATEATEATEHKGRGVRLLGGGRVEEDAVAVVADDDLFAATNLGHHLRPERHEAGRARAVARLGHGHAAGDARDDA